MRKTLPVLFISFIILLCTACGENSSVAGKWAYNYEPEETVLKITGNGQAVYDGTDYECIDDGQFLTLTSSGEEAYRFRYILKGDEMLLYIPTKYTFSGDEPSDNLIGLWQTENKKWSFEFTKDGRFSEDGLFSGKFISDKGSSTFTLDYNEDFEDTICYYSINGDTLTVEYPWTMVRSK